MMRFQPSLIIICLLKMSFYIQSFSYLPVSTIRQISMSTSRGLDHHFMKLALRHAQHSFREKEVPIGAVLVDEKGAVIATARNRVETLKDATAHAEIQCLRAAAGLLSNWRLHGCTLYTTLEPCPMCVAAIQAFRVKKVIYGAKDIRMGALGSYMNMGAQEHPFHQIEFEGGVLDEDSSILLKRFFQMRRRENVSDKESILIHRGTEFSSLGIKL